MKKTLFILVSLLTVISVYAQTSQKMSYQGVVRNSDDELLLNSKVGVLVSILQNSADGTVCYQESQIPTTNQNGLFSIEIGNKIGFDTINWTSGDYFMQVDIDIDGGTNYTISGVTQLQSVPFSYYANNGFSSATNEIVKESRGVKFTSQGDTPYNKLFSVGGFIALAPGNNGWGSQFIISAEGIEGGKAYLLSSLGGWASEGQGKLKLAGPSGVVFVADSIGNFGIGTDYPATKLQVTDGDVYIEKVNSGVIMTSPNGTCWRMTVSDNGSPVFTEIDCPSTN